MIPSPMKPTPLSGAMSATSRGLDPQPLAAPQATGRLRGKLVAVEQVAPRLARLPAGRARRGVPAALGQQRVAHVRERLELPHHAVAAAMLAVAAGAAPQLVADDAQRELEL